MRFSSETARPNSILMYVPDPFAATAATNNLGVEGADSWFNSRVVFQRHNRGITPFSARMRFWRGTGARTTTKRISGSEVRALRVVFRFLLGAYRNTSLSTSRLATDQTYFYTLLTTILKNDLTAAMTEQELRRKLATIGEILDGQKLARKDLRNNFKLLEAESKKQTTDLSKRLERERLFLRWCRLFSLVFRQQHRH